MFGCRFRVLIPALHCDAAPLIGLFYYDVVSFPQLLECYCLPLLNIVFVGKMEELARSQEAKLQEAVIGIGDLKLFANAKRFEISQTTWFSMPEERRRAHLKKFSESFQPFAEDNSTYDTPEVTAIPDETHSMCPHAHIVLFLRSKVVHWSG